MTPRDTAYRGYLIRFNIVGGCWIETSGAFIAYALDLDSAKRIIDSLLD